MSDIRKKLAKSLAAKEVLEQLREQAPEDWSEWLPGEGESPGPEGNQEESASLVGGAAGNPINELQELCQKRQISLPIYEFEPIPEGFLCTVQAMGLQGTGEGGSKKEAKVRAARGLLEGVGQ